MMHFHHGNISKALVALFPEVGIERQGFQDRCMFLPHFYSRCILFFKIITFTFSLSNAL